MSNQAVASTTPLDKGAVQVPLLDFTQFSTLVNAAVANASLAFTVASCLNDLLPPDRPEARVGVSAGGELTNTDMYYQHAAETIQAAIADGPSGRGFQEALAQIAAITTVAERAFARQAALKQEFGKNYTWHSGDTRCLDLWGSKDTPATVESALAFLRQKNIDLTEVKQLSFNGNVSLDLSRLAVFENLEQLEVEQNTEVKSGARVFGEMPALAHLNLFSLTSCYQPIDTPAVIDLSNQPSLKFVTLSNCDRMREVKCGDSIDSVTLKDDPALDKVNLGCRVSSLEINNCRQISSFDQLHYESADPLHPTKLVLVSCSLAGELTVPPIFCHVSTLDLRGTLITTINNLSDLACLDVFRAGALVPEENHGGPILRSPFSGVADLSASQGLRCVEITHCGVTEVKLPRPKGLVPSRLETVRLSNTKVSGLDLGDRCNSLRELALGHTMVSKFADLRGLCHRRNRSNMAPDLRTLVLPMPAIGLATASWIRRQVEPSASWKGCQITFTRGLGATKQTLGDQRAARYLADLEAIAGANPYSHVGIAVKRSLR